MKKINYNQPKYGAILAYTLIAANAFYGLLITPYIIESIGLSEFGVYKAIGSLSASLIVLDLGIGSTVIRFIAKFNSEEKDEEIPKFLGMILKQSIVIILLLIVIGVLFYSSFDNIFSLGLTIREIARAKELYIFMILSLIFTILDNVVIGVVSGLNHFIYSNSSKLLRLVFRVILVYVLIGVFSNATLLVVINLGLSVLFLFADTIYMVTKLKIVPVFGKIDKSSFRDSLTYTFFMFLTAIAIQVNGNLDNVVIAMFMGSSFVAVYSMGLLVFNMFQQLSTSISSVMLPTVTEIVRNDEDGSLITMIIIRTGRIQFFLLGAAVVGFLVLGEEFIFFWLGSGFNDLYIIILILIVPAMFELCVNVVLSVLRVKNLIKFRTIVLFASTIVNAAVTFYGVRVWGYYAAAIGTAISFFFGSLIIMNIYYHYKLNIKMIFVYKNVIGRTWIPLFLTGFLVYLIKINIELNYISFFAMIISYIVIYIVLLVIIGLNNEEKNYLISILSKIKNKSS